MTIRLHGETRNGDGHEIIIRVIVKTHITPDCVGDRADAWSNIVHVADANVIPVSIGDCDWVTAVTTTGCSVCYLCAVGIKKRAPAAATGEVNKTAVCSVVVVSAGIG